MSRRTLSTFPSSFFRRAPVVAGATACKGTSPAARDSDRPRPALFRKPAKAYGIPRIGVPSTVATAGNFPGSASRSRRPHVLPMAGDNVLWMGLASAATRKRVATSSLLALRLRESRSPLQPCWGAVFRLALASPRLGLTTQARQRGSVCWAIGES